MEAAVPIMAIYRSSDVDEETFNRYRAEVPIEPVPYGAIFHQTAFGADGLLVIDVWDTEAELQAFNEARVYPAMRKMGLTPIEPQVLQIHELWAAPGASKYDLPAPLPQSVSA
jgi:hypothetical protein